MIIQVAIPSIFVGFLWSQLYCILIFSRILSCLFQLLFHHFIVAGTSDAFSPVVEAFRSPVNTLPSNPFEDMDEILGRELALAVSRYKTWHIYRYITMAGKKCIQCTHKLTRADDGGGNFSENEKRCIQFLIFFPSAGLVLLMVSSTNLRPSERDPSLRRATAVSFAPPPRAAWQIRTLMDVASGN